MECTLLGNIGLVLEDNAPSALPARRCWRDVVLVGPACVGLYGASVCSRSFTPSWTISYQHREEFRRNCTCQYGVWHGVLVRSDYDVGRAIRQDKLS
jgi:hypothetical protein